MKTTALLTCLAIALAFGGGTYLAIAAEAPALADADNALAATGDENPGDAPAAAASQLPERFFLTVRIENRGHAETVTLEVEGERETAVARQVLPLSAGATYTLTQEVEPGTYRASLWNPLFSGAVPADPADCATGAVQVSFILDNGVLDWSLGTQARCIEAPQ